MSTSNLFSNNDPNLPNIKIKSLPRISRKLPELVMSQDNLLFNFDDETSMGMDEFADKFSNIFFNS